MSVARNTFWIVTIRFAGGCLRPRKYGTRGCIPAVVKRALGSYFNTSGALGSRTWFFASKNLKKRSLISELSTSGLLTQVSGDFASARLQKNAGRPYGHSPRSPAV